jgi:hypothetical protein
MSRIKRLRPLAGLLAMGLAAPAFADPSVPFPTYQTGPQPDGSWVVSSGQIITPAGIQVDLGDQVRAKAVAVNLSIASHTAAVLTQGRDRGCGGVRYHHWQRLPDLSAVPGFERQL